MLQILDTFPIWMCVPKYVHSRHTIISWLTLLKSRWYVKFNFFLALLIGWNVVMVIYSTVFRIYRYSFIFFAVIYTARLRSLATHTKKHTYHCQKNVGSCFFKQRNTILSKALKLHIILLLSK